MNNSRKSRFTALYVLLILFFLYLPVICVVVYSFNTSKSGAIWTGVTLDWYAQMFRNRDLISAFTVSAKVAFLSAATACVVGTLGALGLDKLIRPLKIFLTGTAYIPLIVPEIILGVALMMFFSALNIEFGIVTLVLSHATFCIPYIMVMVLIRLRAIEQSVVEAARDLGASKRQVFFTITLPLIYPGILSGALLAIAMSLDDVIISFFLSGPKSVTLPVKIFSMLKLGVTPEINALCTILLLLTFAVVGVTQLAEKSIFFRKG